MPSAGGLVGLTNLLLVAPRARLVLRQSQSQGRRACRSTRRNARAATLTQPCSWLNQSRISCHYIVTLFFNSLNRDCIGILGVTKGSPYAHARTARGAATDGGGGAHGLHGSSRLTIGPPRLFGAPRGMLHSSYAVAVAIVAAAAIAAAAALVGRPLWLLDAGGATWPRRSDDAVVVPRARRDRARWHRRHSWSGGIRIS